MNRSATPIVSVVIPTRNRPKLLLRAIMSAITQTVAELEVIIVVDGVDPATMEALAAISDPRLHTVPLLASVGGSEARNIGIQKSRGEYIALLDDDDEWHSNKLSAQLSATRRSSRRYPVVTSRLIARRPAGDEIWPSRKMRANEPISEYLFCREASIRQGEGFIQTSTLLIPRELMLRVPFQPGLPRHQDWDWLIRAAAHPEMELLWVWEALVIYHIDAARKSISTGRHLKPSSEWIDGNSLVTPKARAYFYATQIAVRCYSLTEFLGVVRGTLRYPRALMIGMGLALMPRCLVHQLRKSGGRHA